MSEGRKGILTSTLAVMCHYCPICMYGRGKPESVIGKILHHRLHADHCPMWKAEKAKYGQAKE